MNLLKGSYPNQPSIIVIILIIIIIISMLIILGFFSLLRLLDLCQTLTNLAGLVFE